MKEGDIVLVKEIPGRSKEQYLICIDESLHYSFYGYAIDGVTKKYLFQSWCFDIENILAIVEEGV